ncbi:hypothetical protein ACFLIM_12740 [Nonomuraea sp. M3C6]|uniref:Uncharacterized protein n=1 Tax=Nonomuraea marmarensis TaxID=3351344 RepID=A0ABW7AAJ9_9ACTN
MPELKSVIAGLAISTALTGGVVGLGAATTAASAAAQVSTGTSVLTGHGCGWRRCGGGGRHHNRVRVNVFNNNVNRNDNINRRHERRFDRFNHFNRFDHDRHDHDHDDFDFDDEDSE